MGDYEEDDLFFDVDEETEQEFEDFIQEEFGDKNAEDLDEQNRLREDEDGDFNGWWNEDGYEEGEEEEPFELEDEDVDEVIRDIFADDGQEPLIDEEDDQGQDDQDPVDDDQQEENGDAYLEAPALGAKLGAGPGVGLGVAPGVANFAASAVFQMIQVGIQSTTNIISPSSDSTPDKAAWKTRLTNLKNVYEGAKALVEIQKYVSKLGQDDDVDKLKAKLDEVIVQMKHTEETVKQGFADLIAHDEFSSYRNDVMIPTKKLFDSYTRSHEVLSKQSIADFKADCEQISLKPAHLLSTLTVYLAPENSVILKHLEAKNYSHKEYTKWVKNVRDIASKLSVVSAAYYGILYKEDNTDEAKSFKEQELAANIRTVDEIKRLTAAIELERLKGFHESGSGAKLLQETFDDIKPDNPGMGKDWGTEFLPKWAFELKKKWKTVNGRQNFFLALCRGYTDAGDGVIVQAAQFHIGDKKKVSVAPNAAYAGSNGKILGHDGICIVLIQPFTKEMYLAHKAMYNAETRDKIVKIMKDNFSGQIAQDVKLSKIKKNLLKIKEKGVLLAFFNTDTHTARLERDPAYVPYAYRMVGETSSFTPAFHSFKCDQHVRTGRTGRTPGFCVRVMLQVIFQ